MRFGLVVAFIGAFIGMSYAAELRAGRAAVVITPPVGIPMAGYYNVRLAEGTHDDLYAKALVIEGGAERIALVACDLLWLEDDLVAQARKEIASRSGLSAERVMISATHSHTGPVLRNRFLDAVTGPPRLIAESYRAALPGLIAESVRLAIADLQPARVSAGTGQESSLSFNRRFFMKDGSVGWNPGKLNPNIVRPAGPIDPAVGVVLFEGEKQTLATYVNFALHLDTVGGLRFSADYPATLSSLLAKIRGSGMLTLFTIGTAGNINHIDVSHGDPQKGTQEAARIGTVLAGEVLKTYTRLRPINPGTPRARREIVRLETVPHDPSDLDRARTVAAAFGQPPAPALLDQVKALRVLDVAERNGRPLEAEVQVITVGQIAWVGLPGEVFVELGMAIKKASPFPHTFVVELANGWIGYVPDRPAYSQGAYEVVSARCASGSGEALVDAAVRLLKSLAGESPAPR